MTLSQSHDSSSNDNVRIRDSDGVTGAVPILRLRWKAVARLFIAPLLFLLAGVSLLFLLGAAQKLGWISAGSLANSKSSESGADQVDYICPMMCTPPQKVPGRCPVCAMELVPASQSGSDGDKRSIVVDAATRRIANIQTAVVRRTALDKIIRVIGELRYDEGNLKTISAYTDGRFDRLYVDYTGAVVSKGDKLASFFSPELYSAQVEYLQATEALTRKPSVDAVVGANRRMQTSARQRLIEYGLSEQQIEQIAAESKVRSRLDIIAPISGTVIEKLAEEGEYVKAGDPVFRLADLSTVWLMLDLFPEDAATVRYGMAVEAILSSLPDRTFVGRVAFVDPEVDQQSRTVQVRVILDNADGVIRIGDYAKARIKVPLGADAGQLLYDPELANKWISPRHPEVIRDQPGLCPKCGIAMIPSLKLGFSDQPQNDALVTVVPRNAVLRAANESIVYVEVQPGRFEIRRVVTGAASGDQMVIVSGLNEGEKVATSGNFLLDSQMQLAGNPSLIDPTRFASTIAPVDELSAAQLEVIRQLPQQDQLLAIEQVICPVTDSNLGSMGVPIKVMVQGTPVFACCEGCRKQLLASPKEFLQKLRTHREQRQVKQNSDSEESRPNTDQDYFPVPQIEAIQPILDEDASPFEVPEIGPIETLDPRPFEVPNLDESNGIIEFGGAEK